MQILISMAMDFLEHPVRLVVSICLMLGSWGCRNAQDRLQQKVEWYPGTKDTAVVTYFLNGKEQGRWVKYHPNGKIREERFFDQGKKVGLMRTWWEDGQLQSSFSFKDDEYEGECSEWNEKGILIRRMHYARGHESGAQQQWYDDGSIRSNYVIIKGRRFGLLGTKNCVNVSDSLDRF